MKQLPNDSSDRVRVESSHSVARRIRWKQLFWILLVAATAIVLGVVVYVGPLGTLGHIIMSLSEDTEFAPGYSERAFQQIAIGDAEASVRAALGAPLSERRVEPYVCWLYAPDPAPEFEANGSYPDIQFSFTAIEFEEGGTFAGAFGQISNGSSKGLLSVSASASFGDGMNTLSLTQAQIDMLKEEQATPQEIEARFGKPSAIFKSRVAKWLHYSHSPGSTHYRQRFIGIDRNGKVCRKRSEFYWD